MERYGWWSVKLELTLEGEEIRWDDLDECSQEHIVNMIKDGYTGGEICMPENDN